MDVTVPRFLLERRKKKKRKKEIHFVYACRIETLVHVDNVNKLISKGRSIRRIDNISRVYTEYLPLSRLCHSARRYVVRSVVSGKDTGRGIGMPYNLIIHRPLLNEASFTSSLSDIAQLVSRFPYISRSH